WPFLLVVVVLALNTPHPLKLLSWFWLGGMLASIGVGAAIVFTLDETAVRSESRLPAAPWVYVVVGGLSLLAAEVVPPVGKRRERRARETTTGRSGRSSGRVERLVERGGRLAFVGGIVASVFPGPLAIIAMTQIAQLGYSTAATMAVIVAFFVVMFTFVEVPIVAFALSPEWTKVRATRFNSWLDRNLVTLGVWALTIFGAVEVVRGLVTALR